MNTKRRVKILILSIVLLSAFLPLAGLSAETNASKTTNTENSNQDSIKNIEKLVKEKTPEYISRPIINVVDGIEEARLQAGILAEKKSQELKIEAKQEESNPKKGEFQKIFKHIESFFCSLLSLILNTKWLFYVIFIGGFLLALRYIWQLIF